MRKFEKISFDQFKKDVCDNKKLYEKYTLPKRSTVSSAAYDIASLEDYTLKPGESRAFNTGLKVSMYQDEVLYLFTRSSMGYKYDVTLSNSVGVIDSDFYNNEDNEGHFRVKLYNHGEKDFVIKFGDRIAQGVFMKFLTVEEEEEIKDKRKGGLGSTNKKEDK